MTVDVDGMPTDINDEEYSVDMGPIDFDRERDDPDGLRYSQHISGA